MTIVWLDHTADDGFIVESGSIDELFAEAATALARMIVVNADEVQPARMRDLELVAEDLETLLFDWLSELLWLFNGERWIWRDVTPSVDLDQMRLTARLTGERFDPDRHVTGPEIKAITWHGFAIERHGDGWRATVIVDI